MAAQNIQISFDSNSVESSTETHFEVLHNGRELVVCGKLNAGHGTPVLRVNFTTATGMISFTPTANIVSESNPHFRPGNRPIFTSFFSQLNRARAAATAFERSFVFVRIHELLNDALQFPDDAEELERQAAQLSAQVCEKCAAPQTKHYSHIDAENPMTISIPVLELLLPSPRTPTEKTTFYFVKLTPYCERATKYKLNSLFEMPFSIIW